MSKNNQSLQSSVQPSSFGDHIRDPNDPNLVGIEEDNDVSMVAADLSAEKREKTLSDLSIIIPPEPTPIPRSYKRDETKAMLTKRPLAPSDLKFDPGRKLLLNGDDAHLIKELEEKVYRFEGSYSSQLLMEAVRMQCDPTRHDLLKINCEGVTSSCSSNK
jgi:hypothetical protein